MQTARKKWGQHAQSHCHHLASRQTLKRNKTMNNLKKILPDLIVVALFATIAFAYFLAPVSQGKILFRHDSEAAIGIGKEQQDFKERTGETTRWTNAVFSGMPTYQLAPSYQSTEGLSFAMEAYHLWLPDYVWYLFAYLLGFYILLRAFDFRQSLAALGSILWAFSTYFLIIIAAGHIWKVMALAYLPPMIAGIVLAYRGRLGAGFVVTALFTAFEVKANHVQMTYYFLIVVLCMMIAYFVDAMRKKQIQQFLKATGVLAAAGALAIAINLSNLYHTWEYQKESMRGKSELRKANAANQTSSGLERDYITQWSYGIDETATLLIPGAKGGASVPLRQNDKAMAKANSEVESMLPQLYDALPQYFGTQPGTSGPVYVGAFVCFLFIFSLFIVRGSMKWALLAATLLSIMLAWGRNFMGLTDFFIDHVPMYAKFRTVASILVVAEFTIPLLAMLALKRLFDDPTTFQNHRKAFYGSLAFTAGLCLLIGVFPELMGSFISQEETQMIGSIQGITPELRQTFLASITTMREAIVSSDAFRSLWVILIGAAIMVYTFDKKTFKIKPTYAVIALAVLCIFDLWDVNKRYLNDEMFVAKSQRDLPQQPTKTDEIILQDPAKDYRVLNFATSTFNENNTAYFHKSIGGYHPAKLRRYQEMIDKYIMPEMKTAMKTIAEKGGQMGEVDGRRLFPVLNMLNTKYFIFPLQEGETVPLQNPYAQGNLWFVDRIQYVDDANAEYDGIATINPMHEAVADKQFANLLGKASPIDTAATLKLDSYAPNQLAYTVNSSKGGILVFSEIYYPGWKATIDGKETPIGRVNYILRALRMPEGNHKVVLTFDPRSIKTTETIAIIGSGLLLFAILFMGYRTWRKKKQMGNRKC